MNDIWMDATESDRQMLYEFVNFYRMKESLTWEKVFEQATPSQPYKGNGYEDNFRKGKVSRAFCAKVAEWFATVEPRHMEAITATIVQQREKVLAREQYLVEQEAGRRNKAWDTLVHVRGRYGYVDVFPEDASDDFMTAFLNDRPVLPLTWEEEDERSLNSSSHAVPDRGEPFSPTKIRLGETFRFGIKPGYSGKLIGLQSSSYEQWPLRLGNESLSVELDGEAAIFPDVSVNNALPGLVEEREAGRHYFYFIAAAVEVIGEIERQLFENEQVSRQTLNQIAEILCNAEGIRHLLILNVKFRPFA